MPTPEDHLIQTIHSIAAQIEAGEVAAVQCSFASAWRMVQAEAHQTAVNKGWWETPRSFGEIIALMHSELSEALENHRQGGVQSDHIPAFSGIEEEFADVIIRMMDYAQHNGLRIPEAVAAKMQYNLTRPHRHGGKVI